MGKRENLQDKFAAGVRLTRKVAGEFYEDPLVLFKWRRMRDLVRKGRVAMGGIGAIGHRNEEDDWGGVELKSAPGRYGSTLYGVEPSNDKVPLMNVGGVVFARGSRVMLPGQWTIEGPSLVESGLVNQVTHAVSPVTVVNREGTSIFGQGHKTFERGVVETFKGPSRALQVGYGAFRILADRSVELVFGDRLDDLEGLKLERGEELIMANWQMTNDNWKAVCDETEFNRPEGRPYNGLGEMIFADGTKLWFGVNGEIVSSTWVYKDMGIRRRSIASPTLEQVAGFCNLLAKEMGASGWRVCGVEYNNGGTFELDKGEVRAVRTTCQQRWDSGNFVVVEPDGGGTGEGEV